MATDQELQHLRKLRAIHEDKRRVLELQLAAYSNGTAPAEKVMELHDAVESIARIDAQLLLPTISPDVQAATGPDANIDVLRLEVKRLGERLNDAISWTRGEVLDMRDGFLTMRDETRVYRAQNEINRRFWQRANFVLLLLIALAVGYQVFLR